MKTLVTFCQRTGRRLRLYINRQIAKLSHKGQLKISVAFSLPFFAKLEVSSENERTAIVDDGKNSADKSFPHSLHLYF